MAASTATPYDGRNPEKPSASGFLDPKREESDLEYGSTRAPSTAAEADYDKERGSDNESNKEVSNNAVGSEEPNPDEVEPQEYPRGLKLGFIVIALIMAVFLISLDMVRTPSLSKLYLRTLLHNLIMILTWLYSRRSSRPPSPRSPTSSTAWAMSPGTPPPSS